MYNLCNLDKKQKTAVYSNNSNILIVASPGSGKTTVIINRIVYLINIKKIDPNNILVLTFTKAAALNMKQRYKYIIKNKKVPFFGTFHGLCYKILSKNLKINIISNVDKYRIIIKVLRNYLEDVSEEKVKEIINEISFFKSSALNIKDYYSKIDKNIFKECLLAYENYKKYNKLMDFDDLQINVIKLLKKNYRILDFYRRNFKYILVDEFQDCDGMQLKLLKILNKNNFLFAVGDEDQCIYGFRGSKPECMVKFNEYFDRGEKIFLCINYRSGQSIVNISKNLIENNKIRNNKKVIANKNLKGNVKVICVLNERLQGENIAEDIKKIILKRKYKFSDIAVLYRTNIESRSLIDIFLRKNIPFNLLDKDYNFFDNFICKDILAFLKLSIDKSDKESFIRIINKPYRYISKINIHKLRRKVIRDNCFDLLKNMDIPIFQMKSISKLEKGINKLKKLNLIDGINSIIYDLGYWNYINEYSSKFKLDIEELKNIIYEFKQCALDFSNVKLFLIHIKRIKSEIHKKFKNQEGVILSTIHGVKGMEFKNVFIINCNEGNIPYINNNMSYNLEEERRLFYVGITRTIENLWIYTTKTIRGKNKEASRFIKECNLKIFQDNFQIYKKGDYILHKSFGKGKVINSNKENITISFKNNIIRKFNIITLINNRLINFLFKDKN